MQPVVTTRELRRDILDLAERAVAGEAFVVMRHGRPVALLRKARPEPREIAQNITRCAGAGVHRRAMLFQVRLGKSPGKKGKE